MNTEIVSVKLLIFSGIASFFILCTLFIHSKQSSGALAICNSENTITVVFRESNYDILLYPVKSAEALDCLRKIVPFYDKKIDVLVTSDKKVAKEIALYYKIGQINTEKVLGLKSAMVTNNKSSIEITTPKYFSYIYKRSPNNLPKINVSKRARVEIFRPLTVETVEGLLSKSKLSQRILNNGEVLFLSL